MSPRASPCLAQGLPGPTTPHLLPEQSIKCSGTPQALRLKANPLHAGPLTPPGNHIPTMFTNPPCAAIPGTVRVLCGKASVNSVTLCHPLPYRHHDTPLEEDGGTL
jgi:hypothetical protein